MVRSKFKDLFINSNYASNWWWDLAGQQSCIKVANYPFVAQSQHLHSAHGWSVLIIFYNSCISLILNVLFSIWKVIIEDVRSTSYMVRLICLKNCRLSLTLLAIAAYNIHLKMYIQHNLLQLRDAIGIIQMARGKKHFTDIFTPRTISNKLIITIKTLYVHMGFVIESERYMHCMCSEHSCISFCQFLLQ